MQTPSRLRMTQKVVGRSVQSAVHSIFIHGFSVSIIVGEWMWPELGRDSGCDGALTARALGATRLDALCDVPAPCV